MGAEPRPGGVGGGCQDLLKALRMSCLLFSLVGVGALQCPPVPVSHPGSPSPGSWEKQAWSPLCWTYVPDAADQSPWGEVIGEPPVSLQAGQVPVGVWCCVHSAGAHGQGKAVRRGCPSPQPGEGPPQGTSLK